LAQYLRGSGAVRARTLAPAEACAAAVRRLENRLVVRLAGELHRLPILDVVRIEMIRRCRIGALDKLRPPQRQPKG